MREKRITTRTPNFLSQEFSVFGGALFHASTDCSLLVQPEGEKENVFKPHEEMI